MLSSDVMTTVVVAYPSIRRALRSGRWKKLGRFPLHKELQNTRYSVQWPAGTLNVTVWAGGKPSHETRVEDPAIQNMEIIAAWDAEHHIPPRLTADFGEEAAAWHIGGPIWRERKVKEETARRFPDQPWHRLPRIGCRLRATRDQRAPCRWSEFRMAGICPFGPPAMSALRSLSGH